MAGRRGRPPGCTHPTFALLVRLVALIDQGRGVSSHQLAEDLGVGRATVVRALRTLRQELGMAIIWQPDRDGGGHYLIEHWGVFEAEEIRRRYPRARRP